MPDVWVWMGDLAYMDIPAVDCFNTENKEHPDCNCTPTLLRHPSHGCKSGDEQNARRKAGAIVRSAGMLLNFTCRFSVDNDGHLCPGFPVSMLVDLLVRCAFTFKGYFHRLKWQYQRGESVSHRITAAFIAKRVGIIR